MYRITEYSYDQAKRLNVHIQPSEKGNYKIDVFSSDGDYITSIGDKNYDDFPTYILKSGLGNALRVRRLYKKRHEKDRHIIGSRGFYSDQILW